MINNHIVIIVITIVITIIIVITTTVSFDRARKIMRSNYASRALGPYLS